MKSVIFSFFVSLFGEDSPCRRIKRIAYFLVAYGRGINEKVTLFTVFLNYIEKNELRHRTAADITVADEHYPLHHLKSSKPHCLSVS